MREKIKQATSHPRPKEFVVIFDGQNGAEPLNPLNLLLGAKHKPNKPLGEEGGQRPAVILPPWPYKSELLTPKPKAYHHLPYRRSPSSPRR